MVLKIIAEHILMIEGIEFTAKLFILITESVDIFLADSLTEIFIEFIVQQVSQLVGNFLLHPSLKGLEQLIICKSWIFY